MTMYNTIWRFMNKKKLLNELNKMHGLYEISYLKAKKHLPRKERIELEKELCGWRIPFDE